MFEPEVLPTSSLIEPSGPPTWPVPSDGLKVSDCPCITSRSPAVAAEIKPRGRRSAMVALCRAKAGEVEMGM